MANIKDCCVTFPIGDCDLSDVGEIKRRIIDVIDRPDFGGCFGDLDVQVRTLQSGPTPRVDVEVKCEVSTENTGCTGSLIWSV